MDSMDLPLCEHCGQVRELELFEIWPEDHAFQISTCCEASHHNAIQWFIDAPELGADWLRSQGIDEIAGRPLRRLTGLDAFEILLDFNLDIRPIRQADARAFVAEHHDSHPEFRFWRFGAGIWNAHTLIGVAVVHRPSSPALPQRTWCEVSRLCIRRDCDPGLVWNAASQLLGWCAREARKKGFERIITYTQLDQAGTSLKAAGWTIDGVSRGGTWNRVGRPRTDKAPIGPKHRWSRSFRIA